MGNISPEVPFVEVMLGIRIAVMIQHTADIGSVLGNDQEIVLGGSMAVIIYVPGVEIDGRVCFPLVFQKAVQEGNDEIVDVSVFMVKAV